MKKTIFLTLLVLLTSCATTKDYRNLASAEKDLNGTYVGVAVYKTGRDGPNKPAIRIYLQEIEGEKGQYHAVLLEYVNLLKMAPSYISSNKTPAISRQVGFLKHITQNISAYKVIPTQKEGVYEMWPLVVVDDRIEPKMTAKPRILTLSSDENLKDALEGATISSVRADEPQEIFFPKDDDEKRNGLQYGVAKLTYSKAKLESTWRKNFLPGPYLATYGNLPDVVLELSGTADAQIARFKINENFTKLSEKKRKKMFTNEKSAFLKGDFNVTEPLDGMFLFSSVNADLKTEEIVKGKIGLFIDVFDATKSLNQDVVELALIDSEKPEDFLMYYEHPENGEGTK